MKEKTLNYETPQVRVVKAVVEKGFATSGVSTGSKAPAWGAGEEW